MSNECLSKVSIYERWIIDYILTITITTKFAIMNTNINNNLDYMFKIVSYSRCNSQHSWGYLYDQLITQRERAPIFGVSVNEGYFILIMVVSSFVNPKRLY